MTAADQPARSPRRSLRRLATRAEPNELRFVATLPSALRPLRFTATVTAWWHGRQPHPDPPQLVRGWLGELARTVETRSVLEVERAEAELNWRLAQSVPLYCPAVSIVRAVVRLTVSPGDRLLAEDHAEQLRREAVAQLRRVHELAELRYLRERIFSDPGMARTWWLYKNPARLSELPGLDGQFHYLVEATGTDTIAQLARSIAMVAVKLVDKLGSTALHDLVHNFARLMASQYDAAELSSELIASLPVANPTIGPEVD